MGAGARLFVMVASGPHRTARGWAGSVETPPDFGVRTGYDLIAEVAEPIGGKSSHSGFELGLAVGLQLVTQPGR